MSQPSPGRDSECDGDGVRYQLLELLAEVALVLRLLLLALLLELSPRPLEAVATRLNTECPAVAAYMSLICCFKSATSSFGLLFLAVLVEARCLRFEPERSFSSIEV